MAEPGNTADVPPATAEALRADRGPLRTKDGQAVNERSAWEDTIEHGTFDPIVPCERTDERESPCFATQPSHN